MKKKTLENSIFFHDLEWDTDFFGVTSAKAILNGPITLNEWNSLKNKFENYQFISIENRNSVPFNAKLIGNDTSAFLADVNIQFVKKLEHSSQYMENIIIQQSLNEDKQITSIANFYFSRFTDDIELAKRGGDRVYHQWLISSFNKPDKFFALSRDKDGEINGFLLHSYLNEVCIIELIAVSKNYAKMGVGTSLFRAVADTAYKRGCNEIKVGTQIRNMNAINFYHKVGCKQVGCHQIYHLWNL